jgi:hypothetical protein
MLEGASCLWDTYITVLNPDWLIVTENDDTPDASPYDTDETSPTQEFCSFVTFVAEQTGTFKFANGCYTDANCSGVVSYTVFAAQTLLPPPPPPPPGLSPPPLPLDDPPAPPPATKEKTSGRVVVAAVCGGAVVAALAVVLLAFREPKQRFKFAHQSSKTRAQPPLNRLDL